MSVLRAMQFLFDNSTRTHNRNTHESFSGVKTNENSMLLYKSNEADSLVKGRLNDYFLMQCFGGWATGANWWLFLPMMVTAMGLPRKLAHMHYFTFHAELLPHTE